MWCWVVCTFLCFITQVQNTHKDGIIDEYYYSEKFSKTVFLLTQGKEVILESDYIFTMWLFITKA